MVNFTRSRARQRQQSDGLRVGGRQHAGGQEQPRPRIGLYDVGWCATGVFRPGDTLHRDERRNPDLDAGTGRHGGRTACGEPNRRRQRVAIWLRTGFVAQPVRNGRQGLARLSRIGTISGAYLRVAESWIRAAGHRTRPSAS